MTTSLPGQRPNSSPPHGAILLVSVNCLLLLILQFTSLTKLWVIVTGYRGSLEEYVGLVLNIEWTLYDLTLFGLFGLSVVVLVAFEILRGSWTTFLAWVIESERRTKTVVLAFSLIAVRYYFTPGALSWVGDAALHTLYAWIAGEGFARGIIPIWTPLVAAGTPFLQFYGFLYFYVAGAIQALVGEVELATKITLGGAHALSGVTMYYFVRSALDSRRAGLFAGLTYVLSFWHLQHVLIMGRYPTSLFYALLPVPFHCLHRMCVAPDWRRWTVGGSVSVAALFYTHPGFAIWACVFLLAHGVSIAVLSSPNWRRTVSRTFLQLGLGGILTLYLTIPMWVEREYTALRQGVNLSGLEDPVWEQLLFWSNFHVNFVLQNLQNWYGGYIGIVPLSLAVAGLAAFRWRSRGRSVAVAVLVGFGLIASWGLVFGYRWLIFSGFSLLKTMSPGRFQLFLVFFVAIAAGLAIDVLSDTSILKSRRVFSIALLLLFFDLGPTTFRAPYHFEPIGRMMGTTNESIENLKRNASQLREGRYHDYRIVHASRSHNSNLITETGHPSIVCMYEEHTLADHHYLRPLIGFVDSLIQEYGQESGQWLATTQGNLALQALILTNTRAFMTNILHARKLFAVKLPQASPVHVTARVETDELIPEMNSSSVLDLVARMALANDGHRLGRVFVVDGEPNAIPGNERPTVSVLSNDVFVNRVRLSLEVNRPCFARLAFGYYPELRVSVNGVAVETRMTSAGFTVIELPGGKSTVEISGGLSVLRKSLLAFDIALLVGLLLWCRPSLLARHAN